MPNPQPAPAREANAAVGGYPRLLRRLQGVFIDGIVIPIAAVGTLVALTYAGADTWVKVLCPLLVVCVLEPLAVSLSGGTVGHHLVGLRVRKERADERISVFAAFVRLLVKVLFGLPAFFVAFVTRKRQGLHDLAARSLIVHHSTVDLPRHELLPERTRADEDATYLSVGRRVLVMLLYWIVVYAAWNLLVFVILAGPCVDYGKCSQAQAVVALGALIALLVAFIVVAALGWRGKLYGCRKARANSRPR